MSGPTIQPARRRRGARGQADDGHASVFLLMLMPLLGMVFALVWEGGQMLVAKAELMTTAHSAARAGTHQLDQVATVAEGVPVLDSHAARGAAVEHLSSAGARGRAVVEDGQVVVLAQATYTPALLPIRGREIAAEARATAYQP